MADDTKGTRRLLYTGLRKIDKGWYHAWLDLTAAGVPEGNALSLLGDTGVGWPEHLRLWPDKGKGPVVARGASPGSIYRVEATFAPGAPDKLSVTVNSGVYEGTHPNADDVAAWQAEHQAQALLRRAERKAGKALAARYDLHRLEPLRQAYHRLGGDARNMLLAAVVRAVTSPTTLKDAREVRL